MLRLAQLFQDIARPWTLAASVVLVGGCRLIPRETPVFHSATAAPKNAAVLPSVQHVQHTSESADRRSVVRAAADVPLGPQTLPIDLPTALRLGDANNLDIAFARERIGAAYARLKGAEVLWLPNVQAGSTWMWHDGQIQRAAGEVFYTQRRSLFVGGGPVASVDLADAIFEPLVHLQLLAADEAAESVETNNSLLRISERYFDLLAAQASVTIAQETQRNAAELGRLTAEFAKQGAGLPSDAARAQAELGTRQQQLGLAEEQIVLASTELARLLRLDPLVQLTPAEPNVVTIEVVPEDRPVGDLVAHAMLNRPELAEQQWLVQASVERLRQAHYGPFLPSVLLGFSAGGFGGGPGNTFANFAGREDFTASAVWELRNLGLGDHSLRRLRESQLSLAQIRSLQTADRIAVDVAANFQLVQSRRRQVEMTRRTVESALKSYDLNLTRIRGGAGLPIEVVQSIQALDRARTDYVQAVTSYNKAQFRLFTALGNTPVAPLEMLPAVLPLPQK